MDMKGGEGQRDTCHPLGFLAFDVGILGFFPISKK
jgi:hypothetical protein